MYDCVAKEKRNTDFYVLVSMKRSIHHGYPWRDEGAPGNYQKDDKTVGET